MTELCDHSTVSLAGMIARKDISPVALMESCIARIEQVDPAMNAIVAADQADPDLATADDVFNVIRGVGFVGEFKEIAEKYPEQIGFNVATNVEIGMRMTVDQIAWAMAEHTRLYRKFHRFMEEYDILICPTTSVPPFHKDQLFPTTINGKPLENYISWCPITYGLTITDHPVVVVPCRLDDASAPFGLQIVGRRNQDARLLAIARALETVLADTDFCKRPIPNLSDIINVKKPGH